MTKPRGRPRKTVDFTMSDFKPTPLMLEFAQKYIAEIDDGNDISPTKVLEAMGKSKQNWYYWLKRAGFIKWFLNYQQNFYKTFGLANVHNSIYTHAIKDSPPDRKLYVERFDKEYKPKTEQQIAFVGTRPEDGLTDDEIERQSEEYRKQIESKIVSENAG